MAAHTSPPQPDARLEPAMLAAALQAGEFEPYYQPKIDLETGRVLGVEILARWRRPGVGVLTPASFIAAMEDTPLIDDLTERLLTRALLDSRDWHGPLTLALNVAPRTLEDLGLPERLLALADRHAVEAERITLELTETAMARKPRLVLDCASRLRRRGFKFAIDDFGTGYSSMALLLDLPFTELKIDQSFVTRLADSRTARIVLEAMISLGGRLGMSVVAEGVESAAESDLLRAICCPAAQGFHFACPMPQDALLAWLAGPACRIPPPSRLFQREPS
jgi:EAL domain-containing protein (putative c-di-GMP-specific phosphodiesterase class I)